MSPTSNQRVLLPHSEHKRIPHANKIGKAPADREIRVSVILRRARPLDLASLNGRQLSREEYAASYGASQEDFDSVREFAESHGLRVDDSKSSLLRRRVELQGTVAAFEKAFGVELNDFQATHAKHKGALFHAFTGQITVSSAMLPAVEAVLGLDNRPIATPKIMRRAQATNTNGTFTPPQVAQVYNFPAAPTGTAAGAGQTIGIIELGGGYNPADIANYFSQTIGIPAPSVTAVTLDGGSNSPTTPDSADGEVLLDIEVAGAVAPGANIAVYFTSNTDQGFQDAISTAIHDTENNPSVISISWGGPESTWAQTAINSMDSTCQSAAALGSALRSPPATMARPMGRPATTWIFPLPARTSLPAGAPLSRQQTACANLKLCGTISLRAGARPAAASAPCLHCLAGRQTRLYRRPAPVQAAAACPTFLETPHPKPATRPWWMERSRSWAAPAPLPRSGRA